jgi:hypothetical protein
MQNRGATTELGPSIGCLLTNLAQQKKDVKMLKCILDKGSSDTGSLQSPARSHRMSSEPEIEGETKLT